LSLLVIIVLGVLTIAVMGLDYMIPVWGAKRYGASRWGVWGSVAGMIAGIFFPPLGLFIGALIGAFVAEWLAYRETGKAVKAAWGVFVGTALGTVVRLALSGVIAYYFIRAVLEMS
jgi:uncharacterized protein